MWIRISLMRINQRLAQQANVRSAIVYYQSTERFKIYSILR